MHRKKKQFLQNFTLWRAFLKSCVFGDENESIFKSFISSIIYMTSKSTGVFISNREHIKHKVCSVTVIENC